MKLALLCLCAAALGHLGCAAELNAFLNLSARGRVDRGENILIGGLVVEHRSNVLVRGVGPSLAGHGVNDPVPRPRLTLFDDTRVELFANAGWRTAIPPWGDANGPQPYPASEGPLEPLLEVMQRTGAFPFASDDDAALYLELAPGIYTVHLAADNDVPGVGLLEIYVVTEDIDPFPPAWRVRQSPDTGYTPVRQGFAPIAVVDEANGRTLELTFSLPFQWNLPAGTAPASLSASALEVTWVSGGIPDLQHGRAGVTDSRGWRTAPRYTKTGPNTARVACLTTIGPSPTATVIREEVTLTFSAPGGGTFTYEWGTDDTTNDRIAVVSGQAHGTFRWTKSPSARGGVSASASEFFRVFPRAYTDGRPTARWAIGVDDFGPVLRHGDGPGQSDVLGAREAIVTATGNGQYVMHYDGCGALGWRACQAVSTDLIHWQKNGAILELGSAGAIDSACACSPWMIESAGTWHMFYLATPNRSAAPDLIPALPYSTRKATATSPLGPWIKQTQAAPWDVAAGTYYAATASPGPVLFQQNEYMQFFSVAAPSASGTGLLRTLGLARTADLNGAWTLGAAPLLPAGEQIENASLYFEPANNLWFLFTNHVGIDSTHGEFTDAVWVYWSADPNVWDASRKAIVLDATSSAWSKAVIGMPSVVPMGGQLALLYDGNNRRDFGHMRRDIGVAFIDLPLQPPAGL
jgi:hypothetical protein